MPHAVPCASVSMRIVHAGWVREADVRNGAFAGLLGAQRTVQNNGNVKSEPNTWLVKTLQYVLSTFELFLVLFLLPWFLRWTDFFAFFLKVASRRLHSALICQIRTL